MTKDKNILISEFSQMKEFEDWAGGFYLQVSADPRVTDEKTKKLFKKIAKDEEEHGKIIQRILNIINNSL